MILNVYTYKGSKDSLVGPWVTVGYLVDESVKCNCKIPTVKNIYKKRESINEFDDLLKGNIDLKTIVTSKINTDGDYSKYVSEHKVISNLKAYCIEDPVINIITSPNFWYERLTVLVAVFFRTEYLKRNSRTDYNLLDLENNLQDHLEILMRYRYLPPNYLWDKTMEAFKNIEPKPKWWFNELEI